MKFDATVLSSDGKQLKVSLSRSRGQRSLPKEAVLRNMARGAERDSRQLSKEEFAAIGSLKLNASHFCLTPFPLSLYSFKAHGELAQRSCSSTVRRVKEHYLLRILITG
jgi:hypothetical protein